MDACCFGWVPCALSQCCDPVHLSKELSCSKDRANNPRERLSGLSPERMSCLQRVSSSPCVCARREAHLLSVVVMFHEGWTVDLREACGFQVLPQFPFEFWCKGVNVQKTASKVVKWYLCFYHVDGWPWCYTRWSVIPSFWLDVRFPWYYWYCGDSLLHLFDNDFWLYPWWELDFYGW